MRRSVLRSCLLVTAVAVVWMSTRALAHNPRTDFGAFVQHQLSDHSEQLFGIRHPLEQSAPGPFDGTDNTQAIQLAGGLRATLVSSSVASATDQIAFWPNDDHPTHVIVCDEETSDPAVQLVNLSGSPASNATTLVKGLSSCDPVRRTPWGTILVGEEAGNTGGLYELLDPLHVSTITVMNRATGQTSDPMHLVKRQAVGALSFESLAIKDDGTMIYGDELAPSGGTAAGGIYKFVPAVPFAGNSPIQV